REILPVDIREQQSDGVGASDDQAARRGMWGGVQPARGTHSALGNVRGHGAGVVESAGNRGDRDPRPPRHVLNRRCHTLSAAAAMLPSRRHVNVFRKCSQPLLCVSNWPRARGGLFDPKHVKATLFVTLFAGFSVVAGCAARQTWVLAPGQHPQSFQRTMTVEAQSRQLLYLPAGFDRSGATRYPLLIFLHGSGESGEDLEKLKVHGPPKILGARADFPFIVASPQAHNSVERFNPVVLNAML